MPVAGQEGTQRGLSGPGAQWLLLGSPEPQTPGASEASRFGSWLPGLPAPDPGDFLYAQKVTKKAPGDPDPFYLPNRSG